jgi:ribosomal protein S18 acetylase RimI-like enzyme
LKGNGRLKLMTASVEIRRARAEDAECIAMCLESAFGPSRSAYTPGAFRDTVPSAGAIRARMLDMTIYVAVVPDGEIVGTVSLALDGNEGHLRGMAVRPAWQGHSTAAQLLGMVERDLMAAGCGRLTLDTTLPLERAIRFYERNGFTRTGKVSDYFGMPLYEFAKVFPLDMAPGQSDTGIENR